jgi:hypothetical protein
MSTAILERVIEQPRTVEPVAVFPAPKPVEAPQEAFADPHPLLPVFVAGGISLILAGAFIGSILVWLAVRYSGIMAR